MEQQQPGLDLSVIDSTWTLFLDRDGVINVDKLGSYIFRPEEFVFMQGAPALFSKLAQRFGRVIVVTNQRGVGLGQMTETDLQAIHEKMIHAIREAGGRVDAVYYCTAENREDPRRKPRPAMAFEAQRDFPGIDLSRSVMVGNNLSDMEFGRNAGMYTVFIESTVSDLPPEHPLVDLRYPLLEDFAKAL